MALSPAPHNAEGQARELPGSVHFRFQELTRTDTGLPNLPGATETVNLGVLIETILEPARALVGPLRVNSGYRSPAVNKAIGGARASQHMRGQAADVVPLQSGLESAFQTIKASDIPYDQLIIEPSWLHLSWSKTPRRQCLRAHMDGGIMVYEVA